uniref:Uncharacterized protein n=1 Tax=Caenorhabditis japonica TaxID=281687 RepID=A0A8R1IPG9_CAEJA
MDIHSFDSGSTRFINLNSSSNKRRREYHPNNAIIVNFGSGQVVNEIDVWRELKPFGKIRAVVMCTFDACQAYVTFCDEFHKKKNQKRMISRSARKTIRHLLNTTDGILQINGFLWTISTPKEWCKLMNDVEDKTPTPTEKINGPVTVDQLTGIYTDFVRQNLNSSSMASLSSNSFLSVSSFSLMSLGTGSSTSTCSMAGSCDSTATLTPHSFSIYPAQQNDGFIPLPPPYHILPDTAFFRKTKIIPPPPFVPPNHTQQVMDLYISSAIQHDNAVLSGKFSSTNHSLSGANNLELKCCWWNPITL